MPAGCSMQCVGSRVRGAVTVVVLVGLRRAARHGQDWRWGDGKAPIITATEMLGRDRRVAKGGRGLRVGVAQGR